MQRNDQERAISHEAPLPPAHQPVILRGKAAHSMENGQDYSDPKERQDTVLFHYFRSSLKSWNDWC